MKISQPSAVRATEVISSIDKALGAEYAAFLVGPNVVLTLSGARPNGDQVFYNTSPAKLKQWQSEINDTLQELKQYSNTWAISSLSKNPMGQNYVSFDMLLKDGLGWALSQTNLLNDKQKRLLLDSPLDPNIYEQIVTFLGQDQRFKKLNTEWLQHIASGLLLGYPDKAILGSVEQWAKSGSTIQSKLITADIRNADYYPCPQPVYNYPPSLVDDAEIKKHEHLWNTILQDFYNSSFHKSLAQNEAFKQKIKELGN